MKFRVTMYNENGDEISSDIWYGDNMEKVQFWINLEIRKIIASTNNKKINVNIEQI